MSILTENPTANFTIRSGVSWGPVLAGAVAATAITAMLAALGSGLGLAWVSPTGDNPSPIAFTATAAVWLIIVQWIASFFGGYLAGRLRPAIGNGLHNDEITFRDTAAGLIAWSVAALLIAGILALGLGSTAASIGKVANSALGGTGGAMASAHAEGPAGYTLDKLFRPSRNAAQTGSAEAKAEAGRILATEIAAPVSKDDHDYLVQLVEAQTGLAVADATARVDQAIATEATVIEKAKQAANIARKAAAYFSIYTFFSMLVGAFIACVAGAIGGRQRDRY